MGSTHHERPAIVSRRFQAADDPVRAANTQRRDVLNQHPTWPAFDDEAQHVLPQATALAIHSGARPGGADILAREAAADDVGGLDPVGLQTGCGQGLHVVVAGDLGPMTAEDGTGEARLFAERGRGEARSFEPEGEPADAAE